MLLPNDWEGIAQERSRSWEEAVGARQLQAQLPRQRGVWRRRAGGWLMWVGERITKWGAQMAQCEKAQRVSLAGESGQ